MSPAGQAVWTVATAAGVAALLAASEPVFTAVKLAGAAYLVLIGLQALRAAFTGVPSAHAELAGGRPRLAPRAGFRQGVLSNLGNPKMAVFFTSLLPQFAGDGGASFAGLLALGLLFNLLTFVWLAGYAIAVARAGDALRRPAIRRTIEGVTGAVSSPSASVSQRRQRCRSVPRPRLCPVWGRISSGPRLQIGRSLTAKYTASENVG